MLLTRCLFLQLRQPANMAPPTRVEPVGPWLSKHTIMFWCWVPNHIKMWLLSLCLGRSISTQVWSPSNGVWSVVKGAKDINRGWGMTKRTGFLVLTSLGSLVGLGWLQKLCSQRRYHPHTLCGALYVGDRLGGIYSIFS